MEDIYNFHDRGYKQLFSHPRMVEDLLIHFVSKDLAEVVDFSTLRELNGSYITDEYKKREADIIYELKYKEGSLYFYILLEFQSSVDPYISLRMLTYILLFYQDLLKKRKLKKLPLVLPILLYSGDKKWTAPDRLEELIQSPPYKFMEKFIPSFGYSKIIENEFSPETLKRMDSLSAKLFLVDGSEPSDLISHVDELVEILKNEPSNQELARTFTAWLRSIFRRNDVHLELEDIEGGPKMLEKTVERFKEHIYALGMETGLEKGKYEKAIETARKLLDMGLTVFQVSEATGLSEEEVIKLM
jgi:predicted transposase/invertase (TIGR01784 family)